LGFPAKPKKKRIKNMTQEAKPEDNSRDFPTNNPTASEQQIAAGEHSGETSSDNSTMSEKQINANAGTASKPKSEQDSEQDIVQITLIGSQRAVVKTIHKLYRMGFAAVGDWSPLQRGKKPGEVISVLICRSQK
jgi:hypothetical protein